jgi:peptidoglycan/xylan/chitin deacetylase (PgdA/CDA1 family)
MTPRPVCLTFDNGPEPGATPGVLEVLARRRIPATFFVVGEKLRDPARRALAERARAEGHAIGNHTLTHGRPLGFRGGAEAVREIAEADALIGADLAAAPPLFRPNGRGGALGPHLLNCSAAAYLLARGHTVVLWNAVPRDWDDPEGWPERALAQWRAAAGPVVMVLHDLPTGALRHLDRTLGRMLDAGAVFTPDPAEACIPLRGGRLAVPLSDIAQEDSSP